MQKQCITVLMVIATALCANAQDATMKTLSLDDLSAFKPQAGNWRIVGDVLMDRSADIHQPVRPVEAVASKKNKKQKNEVVAEQPKAVSFTDGKGILLNINDDTKKDQLVTNWEHGDIELELEVMLPKGSNSGIYLQGRYEVQLLDSWGVKYPKFSDIGGIYRNWETDPDKIYMGKAPLSNSAKAPGLWQKMKIAFQAPRFDQAGNKIQNARFISVELNGVKIHDQVEVPKPTGGPIENNERPTGPLMIQGDHGPVAFRNIRYQLLKEMDFSLSDIAYKVYHGSFKSTTDFANLKPASSGTSKELTCEVIDVENAYGIVYNGNLTVPEDGTYTFVLAYSGGGKFIINQEQLFNYPKPDGWRRDKGTVTLKAGTYPFEFYNFKDAGWMPPRLALFIQAPGVYPKGLHAFNSFPPNDNPASSIYVDAGAEPKLLRAFLDFKGKRSERLTHTVGVGDPAGIHYVYDLKAGNLVCAWRGDFVDATPMWHDRGDGSFRPRGAALYLYNNQPLAYLKGANEPFPPSGSDNGFRGKGYEIEASTNRPVFRYVYQDLEIEDRVYPDDNSKIISHEIVIKKGDIKSGLHYKLAEGSAIQQLSDGSYVVDDKQYYVLPGPGAKPFIREVDGKKELITILTANTLKYSIIW